MRKRADCEKMAVHFGFLPHHRFGSALLQQCLKTSGKNATDALSRHWPRRLSVKMGQS